MGGRRKRLNDLVGGSYGCFDPMLLFVSWEAVLFFGSGRFRCRYSSGAGVCASWGKMVLGSVTVRTRLE